MPDSLAIIATGLGIVNAGFSGYQWRTTNRTHVKVTMQPLVLFVFEGPDQKIVHVKMVNQSRHEVAITHVSFHRHGMDQHLVISRPLPVEEPLPIIIAPRRSKAVYVLESTLEAHRHERLRAVVSTDDDHDFRSKWVVLADQKS
jgi:hypothetical protein